MFYVYILHSHKDHKLYVGCTEDISRRVADHNDGKVSATKHRRPLECIHQEIFPTAETAFTREKYLKSLWSARFKKKLKEDFESKRLNTKE